MNYTNLSTHHIIFTFLLLANQIHLIAKCQGAKQFYCGSVQLIPIAAPSSAEIE